MAKVLIIGIDGGTFDVIKPLVAQGKLGNIGALMRNGTHGFLQTTMPPMTFPAWTSFMTGVNPGKHGIFDFTEHVPGAYSIRFLNARARMARSLWRIASDAGKRVGIISVPVTWPPEKVNGFLISGFDAPGAADGAIADANSMYPPELAQELSSNIGDYIIAPSISKEIDRGRADLGIDIVMEMLEGKIRAIKYLYKKEDWDLFMMVFGECDQVEHCYWKYSDPASPYNDGTSNGKCLAAIEKVYEKIDRAVGELMEMAPRDTVVMLMSDHGFGGTGENILYLNRWLEREKFLNFKNSGGLDRMLTRPLMFAKRYGLKYLPAKLQQAIFRKKTSIANNMESRLRFSGIDWTRTIAYSEETPYYPTIWLNLKGREPEGTVPEKKRNEVLDNIIEALYKWKDPFSGENVVKKVHRREEIYEGPFVEKAADLIINYNEPGGYSYLSKPSYTVKGKDVIRKITGEELESAKYQIKSGSHRDLGIFVAHGEGIKAGAEVTGTNIVDLAPTVLHLMGLPVPVEMDGTLIKDCLKEEYSEKPVLKAGDGKEPSYAHSASGQEQTYSPEEEEGIRRRLKELGYIE